MIQSIINEAMKITSSVYVNKWTADFYRGRNPIRDLTIFLLSRNIWEANETS